MKKVLTLFVIISAMLLLASCGCEHEWVDATCTNQRFCEKCEITDGEALGHNWINATCSSPKICSRCGEAEGSVADHTWIEATCSSPKTCSVCALTEGDPIDHSWSDATCISPKTCIVCQITEGDVADHVWLDATCTEPKTCSVCKATEGEVAEHRWIDATCAEPKTCSICKATEGDPMEHSWVDATCTAPKTCSVCKTTEGSAVKHSYKSSVTTEASCQKDGVITYTCVYCKTSYNEKIETKEYSATEIYEMYENSVGEILTYKKDGSELSIGTCFVYGEDGKLITNYHVIDGAYSAKVKISGKEYTIQRVLTYDIEKDLAVVQIAASNLKPVTICSEKHKTGESVYAIGSSVGLTSTLSEGIITYAIREIDGVKYVQHNAAVSGGNSGGPLINKYGEVIGINTLTIRDTQNLNFAICVSELDNLKYDSSISVKDLFERESNPYKKLKEYIIENGEYNKNGYYRIFLGTEKEDSLTFDRYAYYYTKSGDITLDFILKDESGFDFYIYITINSEMNGKYEWRITLEVEDIASCEMKGILNAKTFTADSELPYTYNSFPDQLTDSVKGMVKLSVVMFCYSIETDFADIGITSADFGFDVFD